MKPRAFLTQWLLLTWLRLQLWNIGISSLQNVTKMEEPILQTLLHVSGSVKKLSRRDDAILYLIQKLSHFIVEIVIASYILRGYTNGCIYPFIQDKHATRHLIVDRAIPHML